MSTEKPYDDSQVPEGAEKFKDERLDAFLSMDERQMVWESVAAQTGFQWQAMDRAEKERVVKRETKNIVNEVITMAGGIWGQLSTEQKRELFKARFIDKNVAPEKRQAVFEGTEQATAERFPDVDAWIIRNREFLFGMTDAEKRSAYKRAYTKAFTKAREKK